MRISSFLSASFSLSDRVCSIRSLTYAWSLAYANQRMGACSKGGVRKARDLRTAARLALSFLTWISSLSCSIWWFMILNLRFISAISS